MKIYIEILDFEWKETLDAEKLFLCGCQLVCAIVQPPRKNL